MFKLKTVGSGNDLIMISTNELSKSTKNISFAVLGHEECERCEIQKLHECNSSPCHFCEKYSIHQERYHTSRAEYEKMKKTQLSTNSLCVSIDLQKVIMLPRLDMSKLIIFYKRLVAYNQSFVPVGKWTGDRGPIAVVWNEAISCRKKEDISEV